jgi:cardiolipin synthase
MLVLALTLAWFSSAQAQDATAPLCSDTIDRRLNRRLNRRTSSRPRTGNQATLLVDGKKAFERRFALLEDAELVLVKTYIWTDDEVGRKAAEALAERARAGATVVVQYDIKGSLGGSEELEEMIKGAKDGAWFANKPIMADLERSGVIVVPTNLPGRPEVLDPLAERQVERSTAPDMLPADLEMDTLKDLGHFDHEKYWITGHRDDDGYLQLTAIMGGMNIASEYAYGGTDQVDSASGRGGWRDTDVELQGPVVNDIVERYFEVLTHNLDAPLESVDLETWNPPQAPVGDARVRFIWSQPAVGNRHTIERAYRNLMRTTPPGEAIQIEVAYFAPSPRLHKTLRRAAMRGTDLALITNSQETMDVPFVAAASRAEFRQLLRLSPEAALFEWQVQPRWETLHSKVAAFGECGPVIVGSSNLDGLSIQRNSESIVVIEDDQLRADFQRMFAQDLEHASQVGLEELKASPWVRAFEWMIVKFGWALL